MRPCGTKSFHVRTTSFHIRTGAFSSTPWRYSASTLSGILRPERQLERREVCCCQLEKWRHLQVQASGEDEAVRNLTSGEYLPTPGRNPIPQTPNPKPQNPNSRSQTSNPKPTAPNPKPKTQNPKPKTQNPKPKTQNPKPQTSNSEPQTTTDHNPETKFQKP